MKSIAIISFLLLVGVNGFGQDSLSGELPIYETDNLVMVSEGNQTDTFYFEVNTPAEIIKRFGETKLISTLREFSGNTKEKLYTKEEELVYSDLGLIFTFRSQYNKPKKMAEKDSCTLSVATITSGSIYCLDGVCMNVTRDYLLKTYKLGSYKNTRLITISPKSFIFVFKDEKAETPIEIQRSE